MDIFDNAKKLGFGLMRLPLTNPADDSSIDIELTKKMVDIYLERGFTYFDTAIMYCGMKSQNAVKEVLTKRYPRDRFTLATKLHADFFNSFEERDRIFKDQLESTGVDFFDYYLIHDVGSDRYDKYVKYDCFNWLKELKAQGLVKHIGFSFHDNAEMLEKILSEQPDVEFVQLQLNYLDWESEGVQSRKCYEVCEKYGKPVVVMEPVRGGTLANVPKRAEKLFLDYDPDASVASWAIRFAASQPNVKMVLSGMSNMEQMEDNTGFMSDFKPLNEEELSIVKEAEKIIHDSLAIPCTGCSYCTEGCPMKIAIPRYFALYNLDMLEKDMDAWRPQGTYYERLAQVFGRPSECIACGKCEGICPQHLPIIEDLKIVANHFEK